MARRSLRRVLQVILNGRRVGTLERAGSGAISFAYGETWLAWKHTFPISLSLPLQTSRFGGAIVRAVFENLLPDNDEIKGRLAERAGAEGADAFSLLSVVGCDCVGALQFLPDDEEVAPVGAVEGRALREADVAAILRDLATRPLGVDVSDEREFRISIAGAQEKTALLRHNGRWHEPIGATPTTHILKPQIGMRRDGVDLSRSVENEHFCLRLCGALGLPVAETEIVDFEDVRVLCVERFDRAWTDDNRLLRLPQEDFCQALGTPPAIKYNADGGPGIVDCLKLLQSSNDPRRDQKLFLTAQAVFWLMGAIDGHAKNFSVFLQPGGRFRMTPLYDVMSAQPNYDAGQLRKRQLKLAMAVGENRHYPLHNILPRHFAQSAAAADIGVEMVEDIFDALADRLERAIEDTVALLPDGFPMEMVDSICQAIRSRLANSSGFQGDGG